MRDVLNALISTPAFWVFLVIVIVIAAGVIFFRKQLASLIDRTTSVSAGFDGSGARTEINADLSHANPSDPNTPSVNMKQIGMEDESEISRVSGQVSMEDIQMKGKARIRDIDGKK